MQATIEKLYLSGKAAEQEAKRLRATHPLLCVRPRRPSAVFRVLLRILPPLRRRYHVGIIRDCGLFDAQWYLQKYPDLNTPGVNLALHYLLHGAAELRDPGPYFDTGHYLRLYPDIKTVGINPLLHYILTGWDEGRSIRPEMPHSSKGTP
ncbi:hypothetical protein ACS3QZ_19420 (plasmid) [Shimia sp. W99]